MAKEKMRAKWNSPFFNICVESQEMKFPTSDKRKHMFRDSQEITKNSQGKGIIVLS